MLDHIALYENRNVVFIWSVEMCFIFVAQINVIFMWSLYEAVILCGCSYNQIPSLSVSLNYGICQKNFKLNWKDWLFIKMILFFWNICSPDYGSTFSIQKDKPIWFFQWVIIQTQFNPKHKTDIAQNTIIPKFLKSSDILSQSYNTTVFYFDNVAFLEHVLNQLFLLNKSSISQASYPTMALTICFQLFKKQTILWR